MASARGPRLVDSVDLQLLGPAGFQAPSQIELSRVQASRHANGGGPDSRRAAAMPGRNEDERVTADARGPGFICSKVRRQTSRLAIFAGITAPISSPL